MKSVVSGPFVHTVHIRYLEVDSQGVVFNMWYMAYFDDAMGAFLVHNGVPRETVLAAGVDAQLVRVAIDWRGALRMGTPAEISGRTARVGNTSFALEYSVTQNNELTANAEIVYVCVARDGSGKRPVPPLIKQALGLPA